ncbi:hypothetical protein GCM10027430_29280 [Lysobacter tyrosinilyticus]
MTPSQEKKYLAAVLAELDNPSSRVHPSWWICIGFGVVTMALLMAVHRAGYLASPLVMSFIFLFLGMGFGVGLYVARSSDNWPTIRKHFNRDSIKARIDELGA